MTLLIAGGGIGGLTAALSLHAEGIEDVRVLEAVPEIRPLGVGLNVLPNAVKELDELGLMPRLADVSVATGDLGYYNRHGQLIWREPRGLAAGHRWPQLSIHRGRLQAVLADAVRERLGPDAVVTDTRVVDVIPTGSGVRVTARHPVAGTTSTVDAEGLIGADGIHSAVRAVLGPGEGPPPWNGLVVWRGTAWVPPFLDGRSMVIAGDDRSRAVVYPMSAADERGRVLMNWAVAKAAEPGAAFEDADWNRSVEPESFVGHFAHLAFDWLDVPAVIRTATEAYIYPMVDRDPLPRWSHGAVTLIGDAAHAMYPMGSNGATQSIVDARVLATHLARHSEVAEAFAAYEAERLPVLTRLQHSTRRRGPEIVIDLAHERAPGGFSDVREVFPGTELEDISVNFARLGGFDPRTVNTMTPPGAAAGAGARR
ncbi:flavin-dependent oxidoreductase [Streptomyces lydicus]|uniref:flavin-dependent oxidoreductase n=1 Tax=Streptomyces lydicus TaxID=47763 RepID=UPI0028709A8F|nr:flavin-dependent oxidoreductase [Streptomyces lydicus]